MPRRLPPGQKTLPATTLAEDTGQAKAFAEELAEINAVLARSSRLLAGENFAPRAADSPEFDMAGQGASAREALPNSLGPLIRDLDWDEDQRLADWFAAVDRLRGEDTPAVLAAAIAFDAWQDIEPLQHQPWLGTLLVAALLRQRGKSASHILLPQCRNAHRSTGTAERARPDDPAAGGSRRSRRSRRGRTQETRPAGAGEKPDGASAEGKEKELAPAGVDRARLGAAGGVGRSHRDFSQRAALDLVAELGIREVTGRGRYRTWVYSEEPNLSSLYRLRGNSSSTRRLNGR